MKAIKKTWQHWAWIEKEDGSIAKVSCCPSADPLNQYMLISIFKGNKFVKATLQDENAENIAEFVPTGSGSVKNIHTGKRCRRYNLGKEALKLIQ